MLRSELDAIKAKWEKTGFSLTPKKVPTRFPKHKSSSFYKSGSGFNSDDVALLTDYLGIGLTDQFGEPLTYFTSGGGGGGLPTNALLDFTNNPLTDQVGNILTYGS